MIFLKQLMVSLILSLSLIHQAKCDSYSVAEKNLSTISSSGSWVVRVTRNFHTESSVIHFYQYNPSKNTYDYSHQFIVDWLFDEIFVNVSGDRIVVVDGCYSMGLGDKVVVVLSNKGKIIKKWSLENFYNKEDFKKLERTIIRKIWRSGISWLDRKNIVFDAPVSLSTEKALIHVLPPYILNIDDLTIKRCVLPK